MKILLLTAIEITTLVVMGQGSVRGGSVHLDDNMVNHVQTTLHLLSHDGNSVKVKVEIRNDGADPVLIACDPKKSDGSIGPYVELGSSGILLLSSRVFELPSYTLYVNHAGVEFRRVKPGETVVREFVLHFPFRETMPPYGDTPARRDIEIGNVQGIQAIFGVLPDTPEINAILSRKKRPFWTTGQDIVYAHPGPGRAIWQIQECTTSAAVKVAD